MGAEWIVKGPSEVELSQWRNLRLKVHRLENGSYMATVIEDDPHLPKLNQSLDDIINVNTTGEIYPRRTYDDTGALYYVVAVVFIYGFSIILMIGSLIRKSQHDRGMVTYMKDMDKVRRLERRQEKFKVRLYMQHKKIHKILGQNRAIIEAPEDECQSKSMSTSTQRPSFDSSLWSAASCRDDDVEAGGSMNYPLLLPPSDFSLESSPISPCPSFGLPVTEELNEDTNDQGHSNMTYEDGQLETNLTKNEDGEGIQLDLSGSNYLNYQQRIALCTLLEEEEEGTLL